MKKNINLSIGLSVYNEANNIANVMRDILAQKSDGWKLREVLIFDDGSSDKTVEISKSIKSNLISVISDGQRMGKTARLNQMFKKFNGDILIMFDGDIKLSNNGVVSNLLRSFDDSRVMLSGGNSRPYNPKTFFEKAVFSTFSIFYKSRKYINKGNNVFGATGSILAIRKDLAKTIEMPKIVNEDAYIYLTCIKNGYKFKYADDAVIYYKLPTKIRDYTRQVMRSHPGAAIIELKKYFGDLVEQEFHRPKRFYLMAIFRSFIENPIGILLIIFINLYCKIFIPYVIRNYRLEWFTAKSTH